MTLKFTTRDGRDVTCEPIYDKGRVGQVVVLNHVTFGSSDPLSGYAQPSAFVIVGDDPADPKSYVLEDSCSVQFHTSRSNGAYLYPVNQWLAWKKQSDTEKFGDYNVNIERLQDRVNMLTDILVKQGYRVVSSEQAKKLGLS